MSKIPHIPVIVLNWNGISDTLDCVESLLSQDYPNYSIHVADNDSDHGEGKKIAVKFSDNDKVHVYCQSENLGFAVAHNLLFTQFIQNGYEYTALINNDAVAEPDWLSALFKCAQEQNASVVSSKMIDYYDRTKMDNAGHRMLNTGEIIPIGHRANMEKFMKRIENLGSSGGACLYSLRMIDRIGGFDEYFKTGYEDAELGMRAFMAGYSCWFEPRAIVYHKRGRSIRKIFGESYAIQIQTNIWYTFIKLIPAPAIVLSLPFIALRLVLFMAGCLLFLRIKFIRIIWKSLYKILHNDRGQALRARSAFFKSHRTVGIVKLMKCQEFFLGYDLLRVYRYFILSGKSALDQYGYP